MTPNEKEAIYFSKIYSFLFIFVSKLLTVVQYQAPINKGLDNHRRGTDFPAHP